jgi:hypothetical protein
MKTKIKLFVALLCVCGLFAFSSAKTSKNVDDANIWVGIAHLASQSPTASPGASLAIGVVGVWESSIWGAAAGLAFGGPVGLGISIGVSIGVGL